MFRVLLLLSFVPSKVIGFIGYDCGSRQLNVTTLSLREVGECELQEPAINVTRKYVQLLQINEYSEAQVIQCKIEVHRTIYYCGMHSHVSIVANGENEYVLEVSREACKIAHRTGIFQITNSHVIHGLRANHTARHAVLFAGYVNGDGRCNGAAYSDPFGTWESVIVQGTVKITLTEQEGRIKLNSNAIHLRSGTACSLSEGSCIDSEGGYTFWDPIPIDNCKFNRYSVLYEGYANKMVDNDNIQNQVVYSLSTQDITFALASKGKETACGYSLIKTEHPKLLIFETTYGESFAIAKKVSVSNLDIFAYVNSKFVYVEKHIRAQIKLLYRDVIFQKCNLERQTIKNSLSIATQAPDEFAFDLMKGPGYMAVVAGEVVHIIKCVPVSVKMEHGKTCYAELQVTRNNKTFFLTPRTRILKSKGTEVPCNRLLPSYYYVGKQWYKILPLPTEAEAPLVVKPMTKPTWKYTNPSELATNGIYSEQEIEQLRERIMFPIERPAVLNDVAREMQGHQLTDSEGSILKLLNEDAIEKLVDSTWDRMWSRFLTFGTVSAGIIAIMMIIHLIKAVVDIIIQGYALHSVYGWSIHLLGALWSSVSHLLLHLAKPTPRPTVETIELGETTRPPTPKPATRRIKNDTIQVKEEKKATCSTSFFNLS